MAVATRASARSPAPTVAAVLAPAERASLDAASVGCFAVLHRSSLPDVVIMGIVVIGVVAYLFDLLMRYVEHLVVPWKGKV